MGGPAPLKSRIASLDEFRGYTVAGMLLVNFIGGFEVMPQVLRHHNTYCSYADTIMPQFFFAVGFAYRLTLCRRLAAGGTWPAYGHAIRRNLGLILFGIVLYHLDGGARTWGELKTLGWAGFFAQAFKREPFQALVHIGLASIWVLPVIAARPITRVAYLVASGALHLGLSRWFYFDWAWKLPVIDGGPLGFMTWSIPLLVGSLAYDVMVADRRPVLRLVGWSVVLMGLGFGLSCVGALSGPSGLPLLERLPAPPFVPPNRPIELWTMSQRTGSVSYLTFSAGFSLAVYALFVVACDHGSLRVGMFRTFGRNALAAYVLHNLVAGAVKPYAPNDSPLGYALLTLGIYFAITYLFVRHLEKSEIFIRM
jgi:predicted acyltransferase